MLNLKRVLIDWLKIDQYKKVNKISTLQCLLDYVQ